MIEAQRQFILGRIRKVSLSDKKTYTPQPLNVTAVSLGRAVGADANAVARAMAIPGVAEGTFHTCIQRKISYQFHFIRFLISVLFFFSQPLCLSWVDIGRCDRCFWICPEGFRSTKKLFEK